jgi:hypothetical protein
MLLRGIGLTRYLRGTHPVGTLVTRRVSAVFIAPLGRADGRVFFLSSVRRLFGGVTWRLVTGSAPWGARYGHTSVIDAAGAIYVIGGYGGTYYNDVWVSTDGGADRTRGTRGTAGIVEGAL